MSRFRAPTQEQAGTLIAMVAILFGGWVRLMIPWMAGFPVNDGGLFYVMLRALLANGLKIPAQVQYNGLSIPFAYPPLGFYAGAVAALLFKAAPLKVLQWLPAIVLIATLPAFYVLARSILGTSFRAGVATLVYAFTPHAITWQIMGGGLTRSFGQLFLILALAFIYRTIKKHTRRDLLLGILSSSLVVLSHPEAALQTVGLAVILWLVAGRNKAASIHALEIGASTVTLTAIWWLPVVVRYGAGTLLSAAQTGMHGVYYLLQPFLMNFIDEPLMTLIAAFGVVGMGYELSRHRGLLTLWFVAPFLIEPRSAPTVAMVPLAILASIALTDVILPALANSPAPGMPTSNLMRCTPVVVFLLLIALYMLGNAIYFGAQLTGPVLSPAYRAAFVWVGHHTPARARFLILTGRDDLFCDSAQEWFPALTDRISITTIQGKEWQYGAEFGQGRATSQAIQLCAQNESPVSCLQQAASSGQEILQYDYILVNGTRPITQSCRQLYSVLDGQHLIDELRASPVLIPIYDADGVVVFEKH